MPQPIRKSEQRKTGKTGNVEKSSDPDKARNHANKMLFFSLYFCTIIPDGIDIRAYAMKKEKGSIPVIVPVSE